jgi:EAL domain-containing protein (putative c-di-GMP-specific phosphodiesterase class I)
VEQALRRNAIRPELLTFEVAEVVLLEDPDGIVSRLERLKELGVRITLDDFGSGYFSQTAQRKFPFDAIKIGRRFTAHGESSKRARSLTQAFVDLGTTLGLSTLADSLDDEVHISEIERRYCDHSHGYFCTRALSPTDVEELFATASDLGHGVASIGVKRPA